MFSFKRRSPQQRIETTPAAIEPLEGRAYYSATPATIAVSVPGPIPTSVIAGVIVNDRIGVNVVNNDSVRATGRNSIALFVSTDQTLSNDDAEIQTPTVAGFNIAPGRNHTFQIRVKSFPQNLNGSFFILAQVEGGGVNPGVGASTSQIAVEQPVIDLAATAIKSPLNGHAGRRIPVSVSVMNDGNIPAKGALAVNFALSATQDGASPASLGSLTKRINLKPGKSTTLHFSVPLALGVATGNQFVVADIDPSNAFLDPNLLNNVFTDQQPIVIT